MVDVVVVDVDVVDVVVDVIVDVVVVVVVDVVVDVVVVIVVIFVVVVAFDVVFVDAFCVVLEGDAVAEIDVRNGFFGHMLSPFVVWTGGFDVIKVVDNVVAFVGVS